MIDVKRQSGGVGRLLPGVIYEMTVEGTSPQAPSPANSTDTVIPTEVEGEGPDLGGVGFGPGSEPVPGYHLVARIGGGKTGEVWKATGPGGFPVALKFVGMGRRDAADERHSLSLMKDIRHANLLTIFGTWELDGFLVVGMDLADGTLEDRRVEAIRRGKPGIPFRELATYLEQAARGVDFLNRPHSHPDGRHDLGLLHRDIKPQNLLLVGGSLKVGDFGLVASLGQPAEACGSESIAPAYLPPEWAEGRLSRQSDQYGLAMTYCRLGAGCLPSPTNTDGRDPSRGELDLSMLPEGQRPALARALARNPDDRWPDCLTFVRELIRVIPHEDGGRADHPQVDGGRFLPSAYTSQFPRGRRRAVAAASLTLLILAAVQWSHRPEDAREPQRPDRVFETPPLAPAAPENPGSEEYAAREDRAGVDVVEPSTSTPTRTDVFDAIAVMTAPARGKVRRAIESLRQGIASLEWESSSVESERNANLEGIAEPGPVMISAERPLVAETAKSPEKNEAAAGLPPLEIPKPDPSRAVAVADVERKAIEPVDTSAADLKKAREAEADSKAKERELAEAREASRPKTSTIIVLLPNARAELVVRGEVGKGNPDEWYGPKRVIHTPPFREAKDYLVGSFWTDQEGRHQDRAKELKVKPGRTYEVDLRNPVPTFKEVDRSSLTNERTERNSP